MAFEGGTLLECKRKGRVFGSRIEVFESDVFLRYGSSVIGNWEGGRGKELSTNGEIRKRR